MSLPTHLCAVGANAQVEPARILVQLEGLCMGQQARETLAQQVVQQGPARKALRQRNRNNCPPLLQHRIQARNHLRRTELGRAVPVRRQGRRQVKLGCPEALSGSVSALCRCYLRHIVPDAAWWRLHDDGRVAE